MVICAIVVSFNWLVCDLITYGLSFVLSLKSIEKAIVSSNLGMTPNNDGEVIRLSVPQLTSDRRKVLYFGEMGMGFFGALNYFLFNQVDSLNLM